MYTFLESYPYLFLTPLAIAFWFLTIRLTEKEDIRYKLTIKERNLSLLLATASSILIYLTNQNVTFFVLFLMVGIISTLSVSFFIDMKLKELPDCATILSLLLAIPFFLISNTSNWVVTIAAVVAVFVLLFLVCLFFIGIGFGDVKMWVPIGLFLVPSAVLGYWVNVYAIAIVYCIYLLVKTKDRKHQFPFGPFMIAGLLLIFIHVDLLSYITQLFI